MPLGLVGMMTSERAMLMTIKLTGILIVRVVRSLPKTSVTIMLSHNDAIKKSINSILDTLGSKYISLIP